MMMNAFMEPSGASHHSHHLAQYGLKMSPPAQPNGQDNLNNGMLAAMNSSANDHNAVGIANNAAYQTSNYGPSAAASTPYSAYGREYLFKRGEQDYLSMAGQAANPAPTDPMLFPGIHHSHAMHDNQFTSYHQHQMRMGIATGSVGSNTQHPSASIPQSSGKHQFYPLFFQTYEMLGIEAHLF